MWIKWLTNTLLSPQDGGPDHTVPRSLCLPSPITVRGARVEEVGGETNSHPLVPSSASLLSDAGLTLSLLCSVLWWEGGYQRREEITNLRRLHFPAPLLAGSQPGLVLGERRREGGKEKSRYLSPLLLWAVSLEWMHPLHCSVLVGPSLVSWFQQVPCGPNQECGFPRLSFWPRIGRHFLLPLSSGWPHSLLFGSLALLPVVADTVVQVSHENF